eukprot:TRINITY_DN24640_c0_g1_i1.p1 TRINITY_DN24640_c0_g1~~TRINITY_DN24640_c0_g1_i1.p1  ORF type:complete len:327 (-),score=53.15 TRINITY_DN24640_c0_g1_i1:252-1232(-)
MSWAHGRQSVGALASRIAPGHLDGPVGGCKNLLAPGNTWDFPLSRGEKVQRLLKLFSDEVEQGEDRVDKLEDELHRCRAEKSLLHLALQESQAEITKAQDGLEASSPDLQVGTMQQKSSRALHCELSELDQEVRQLQAENRELHARLNALSATSTHDIAASSHSPLFTPPSSPRRPSQTNTFSQEPSAEKWSSQAAGDDAPGRMPSWLRLARERPQDSLPESGPFCREVKSLCMSQPHTQASQGIFVSTLRQSAEGSPASELVCKGCGDPNPSKRCTCGDMFCSSKCHSSSWKEHKLRRHCQAQEWRWLKRRSAGGTSACDEAKQS